MNIFEDIYKKTETLHHAYVCVGDVVSARQSLDYFLEHTLKLPVAGNPDIQVFVSDTFTKDDAHELFIAEERKGFGGGRKIFILQISVITEEAQNALLKVFEEPTEGTHFFVLIPQDILLPTLRSRVQIVSGTGWQGTSLLPESLLKKSLAEKMALVKEIVQGIADEEKTKQDAVALLNQIEAELYQSGVEKSSRALEICEQARASLYDRGAPVKMILEQVMLSV